jgi:sugar transferase (PEP-CTERM/EpsH1 system associated)
MRVLQFAPRICWPLDTGAKLRNYHLARVLANRLQVTLLAFDDQTPTTSELSDVYERIVTAPQPRAYSIGNVLRGAVSRAPLPLLNYTTSEMKLALEHLLDESNFDVIQVESIHLMNYLPSIRAAVAKPLVVCDWHNIESDLMRQYSERERNLGRKAYARKTARSMNEAEQRALVDFDAHLVVSQTDAERLRIMNSTARVFVIENGVDTVAFSDHQRELVNKNRIVFVASMDYHANIDGAINFGRNVWPAVRNQKPDLVFTIVGRNPAPSVRELSSIPGVEVTGTVNDVRPYYREALAAVVPLNVGGGSRLKILEAMAAGVPVVSTGRGAEGLNVSHGENILLVDTIGDLAVGIINVIEDQQLRNTIITGGRKLVAARYDWSRLGSLLFEHYQQLLSERQASEH